MAIERVGIVGSGIMGSGIAEVAAKAGCTVVLRSRSQAGADQMVASLKKSLDRQVSKARIEEEQAVEIAERVTAVTELDALADCDLVLESIVEDLAAKQHLFAELDRICKPEATTTAPPAQAASIASKTAEPLSTERRCSGEPSATCTNLALRTASARPASSASVRRSTSSTRTLAPSPSYQAVAAAATCSGRSKAAAVGRTSTSLAPLVASSSASSSRQAPPNSPPPTRTNGPEPRRALMAAEPTGSSHHLPAPSGPPPGPVSMTGFCYQLVT